METITNIASTATNTVSTLIYGDQTKSNETGGKEPVSGQQGQGTAVDPYDQGNAPTPLATAERKTFLDYSNVEPPSKKPVSSEVDSPAYPADVPSEGNSFLKLSPVRDGSEKKAEDDAPKIHTNSTDATYTGMPIVPLTNATPSGTQGSPLPVAAGEGVSSTSAANNSASKATTLGDVLRTDASAADDTVASTTQNPVASSSITSPAETKQGSIEPTVPIVQEKAAVTAPQDQLTHSLGGDVSPKTSVPLGVIVDRKVPETSGSVGDKSAHTPEAIKAKEAESPTGEEKGSKMSNLKDKLKDKLHIGSKDK